MRLKALLTDGEAAPDLARGRVLLLCPPYTSNERGLYRRNVPDIQAMDRFQNKSCTEIFLSYDHTIFDSLAGNLKTNRMFLFYRNFPNYMSYHTLPLLLLLSNRIHMCRYWIANLTFANSCFSPLQGD